MHSSTRNRRITENLPLIGYLARTICGARSLASRTYLVLAGVQALATATDSFDESRGTSFAAYARQCIVSTIAEEMRASDTAVHEIHTAASGVATVCAALEAILGRRPTIEEIAMTMALDYAAVNVSGDDPAGGGASFEDDAVTELVSTGVLAPAAAAEQGEIDELVRIAIDALPERMSFIIQSLYFAGRTATNIADGLGVAVAAVVQQRSQALRLIRVTVTSPPEGEPGTYVEADSTIAAAATEAYYGQFAQRGRGLAKSLLQRQARV